MYTLSHSTPESSFRRLESHSQELQEQDSAEIQTEKPSPPALTLGLCEDGLPLMLDLQDQSLGAILIASDDPDANQATLTSILDRSNASNSPDQVKVHVCGANSENLIEHLYQLAENPSPTPSNKPIRIFAIPDFHIHLRNLSITALRQLRWLLNYGHQQGIWTLASLDTRLLKPSHHSLKEAFKVCIFGNIQDPKTAYALTDGLPELLNTLSPGESLTTTPRSYYIIKQFNSIQKSYYPTHNTQELSL